MHVAAAAALVVADLKETKGWGGWSSGVGQTLTLCNPEMLIENPVFLVQQCLVLTLREQLVERLDPEE